MSAPTVRAVFEALAREGRVAADWPAAAARALAHAAEAPPWYVRTMVGFGAWIASLLLIGFIAAGLRLNSAGALTVTGLLFIAGAVFVRRMFHHDFLVQAALATSLAGQALFASGVGHRSFPTAMLTLIAVQALLIAVFPDRVHRFLSVLFAAAAAVMLLFHWKVQTALHALVFGLTAAFLWLEFNEARFVAEGRVEWTRPLAYGALIAMLGCVLLSTVYVLPELTPRESFSFYPYPWISTFGLGVLLLYMQHHYARQGQWPLPLSLLTQIQMASTLIVAASLPAPGVAASLLVLLVGFAQANRLLSGLGLGFLSVFLALYFYGMELSMLKKSLTLTATGVLLLAAAYYFQRRLKEPGDAR